MVRFFAQHFCLGQACLVFPLLLHSTCLISSCPSKLPPIITLLLPFPLIIVGGCPPSALSPWLIAFCFSLSAGHMPGSALLSPFLPAHLCLICCLHVGSLGLSALHTACCLLISCIAQSTCCMPRVTFLLPAPPVPGLFDFAP